jgi:hypothetical protein
MTKESIATELTKNYPKIIKKKHVYLPIFLEIAVIAYFSLLKKRQKTY